MPDPLLLTTAYQWDQRQIVRFGGLPVPVFKTVMPYIDLNDNVNWRALALKVDNAHVQNAASQFAWRAKGIWTAQDFVGRRIHIPAHYYEVGSGVPFSRAKAMLTQAGEQYLSFDGITGIRVRCNSFAEFDLLDGFPENPHTSSSQASYAWGGTLEFLSRNPFAEDIQQQSTGHVNCSGSAGGSYTNLNVLYYGHAFASPVLTVYQNANTTGKLKTVGFSNPGSGEDILVSLNGGAGFPSGTSGHQLAFDCDNGLVTFDGVQQVFTGPGFPNMYANAANLAAPALNNFQVYIKSDVTLPGTAVWCAMTWYAKYEF